MTLLICIFKYLYKKIVGMSILFEKSKNGHIQQKAPIKSHIFGFNLGKALTKSQYNYHLTK